MRRFDDVYPVLTWGKVTLPTYSLCAAIGFMVAFLTAIRLLFQQLWVKKYMNLMLVSMIGLLIGSRFFGILSRFLSLLYDTGKFQLKEAIISSGNVFYGGLLGYMITLYLLCRIQKKSMKDIADIVAVIMPLFHGFGRIGCFFGGCCYGKESASIFAIPYRLGIDELWINRFPTQLWEAGVEFFLCGFLLYQYQKRKESNQKSKGTLLFYYVISYAVWRFFVEFFRGDSLRGVYFGISFSQIISACVVIVLILYYKKQSEVIKYE